jgi:hypothetical protein
MHSRKRRVIQSYCPLKDSSIQNTSDEYPDFSGKCGKTWEFFAKEKAMDSTVSQAGRRQEIGRIDISTWKLKTPLSRSSLCRYGSRATTSSIGISS